MSQLTIRNLDSTVYQRLRERARINRRSLEAEVRAILDQSVILERAEVARRAAAMRERLTGKYCGDVVRDIREDRER